MLKGKVILIENFFIEQLGRYRNLRIYLPPNYDKENINYPVFYMHDAQNLFCPQEASLGEIWDIANTMDNFYREDEKNAMVVVGIDNGREFRTNEYSPWEDLEMSEIMPSIRETGKFGGEGFEYIDFIVNDLKPYIDNNFKTLRDRENTGIGGSSLGGLISLVAGIKYSQTFSKIGAFSSALFFAKNDMLSFVSSFETYKNTKIYMDIGTNETSNSLIKDFPQIYLESNEIFAEKFRKLGFNNEKFKFEIVQDGEHNEVYWRERFPSAIKWLYNLK